MKRFSVLGLMLGLAACGQAEPKGPQHLPVRGLDVQVQKEGKVAVEHLQVEIADDDREREIGLMFRKQMAPDAGMLFVWDKAAMRSFWMHNTYIPLDLLFIRDGKVVSVVPWAKPLDDSPLPSGEPADMVLEVNGGWAGAKGVGVGDQINLEK